MHRNNNIAEFGGKPPRPGLRPKPKGGAPKGNRNALKHGRHTAERRALRAEAQALKRRVRAFLRYALTMAALADAGKFEEFDRMAALPRQPRI